MKVFGSWRASVLAVAAAGAMSLAGCAPVEPVPTPTLNEVRLGNAPAATAEDMRLAAGEVQAEVAEVNRPRQEIYVLTPDRRRQTLRYDATRTRVTYHGRDYLIDDIEAGDRLRIDRRRHAMTTSTRSA